MTIECIIALADNGEVGLNNGLPWPHCSEDLRWFKSITLNKTLIVGYNTALTLPNLPGRKLIVQSRDETPEDLIAIYPDLIVIGGPKTYKQWEPYIDRYYIARIRGTYEADAHLKEWAPWLNNGSK